MIEWLTSHLTIQPSSHSAINPFNNINSLQIFQALQFGTAVLIGILLAKSGWPTEQISVYEVLMFVASLFCFFWVVGGQNALLQLFPKLDEKGKASALFNVYFLFTIAALVTGSLLFLTRDVVSERLTKFTALPHLDLLALFLVFNSPAFLVQIYYLLLKQYRQIVVFGIVGFGLQIAVVAATVYLGYSLRGVMWGLVAWSFFRFIWGWVVVGKHASWRLDRLFIRMYLPVVLPLLLLAFIGKGAEYVSGLVVSRLFEDDKAFAVFRYGARELPLAVLLVGALSTSLLPEVAQDVKAGLERIKATTGRLSHWLFPISMISMLASPFLFPVIFNPDFGESARIFNIFLLLLVSRILMPQVVLMGSGKNYFLTLSALAELLILLGLSLWLGKSFGLEGVAFAAVLAFMAERLLLITYVWRALKIPPGAYVDWRTYLGYSLLLILTFLVSLQI